MVFVGISVGIVADGLAVIVRTVGEAVTVNSIVTLEIAVNVSAGTLVKVSSTTISELVASSITGTTKNSPLKINASNMPNRTKQPFISIPSPNLSDIMQRQLV